ncbi:hypothetical protein BURK1_03033 [Burkholderiales bacterium]|nr:hypothetical protein BURK1_03033 [Burkholderiales bacterium]
MDITVHIGWHKTGSTSLQVFLMRNRQSLIRQYRTYYPDEGLLICAHHTVAWAFMGRKTSPWGPVPAIEGGGDAYVRAAIDSARSRGCTSVILSSEEFCLFDPEAVRRLYESLRARASSTRIVAYIRRQDLFAESAYNMEVKWWATRVRAEFDEYLRSMHTPPDYSGILATWASAFGADNLIVRRYERGALEGRDIRADFCRAAGLGPGGLGAMGRDVNDSLGPRTLEMMRVLNNLDIAKGVHEQIVSRLLSHDVRMRSPRCVLFDPEKRRAYMASLYQANMGLTAFGVDPAVFALDDDACQQPNVRRLTTAEFTEIFAYLSGSG